MRHAIVDAQTKEVVNVVLWEGKEWLPPRGHLVVRSDHCDVGDIYDEATNAFKKPQSQKE